jgi:Tol biopolymer transport system component/DNA-binding winged helix-turn-helix (wHTH) protein
MTNSSSDHPSERARFGPFEVDLHTRELWKFGTRLKLVGQPFEILAMLLSRPGKLVTREELRNRLWPSDTFVDFNHGLNAAVNKLREALSDSAEDPRYIETLPRRGYRFRAEVEWLESPTSLPEASGDRPEALVTSPQAASVPVVKFAALTQPVLPSASRRNWFAYALGAAVVCGILVFGSIVFEAIARHSEKQFSRTVVERTAPLLSIGDTASPAFSPDGNQVAFYRAHSAEAAAGIYRTSVGSNQLLQLTNNEDDCCPVWSPDGHWIAFTREHNHEYSIYLVASDGGGDEKRKTEQIALSAPAAFQVNYSVKAERKLDTGGVIPRRGEIDWSPDGKSIVFAGPDGIYLMRLDQQGAHRITQAPPLSSDWGPAFSPDGTRVLFVRDQDNGLSNEIRSVSLAGGGWTHIFSEPGRISSPPQWSSDGESVIFSSNRSGHPAIWRVALDSPDICVQIGEAGSPAWDPAVSRRGYRLAYERLLRSLSIWQMDMSGSKQKPPYLIVSSTSDTDQGPGPQFSPDGKRLAYMSDRKGTMEIWISNRDGGNAFQLTAVGDAGTPRWSPDSQAIVFDTMTPTGSKIVTMSLNGGAAQMLTQDSFHSVCPSWSHDGKTIYFGSERSRDWQVWKMPAQGGTPVQVTRHGGHAPLESLDGKFLYYSKTPKAEPEIWRVPVDGGEETQLPLVRPGTWASWQVVEGGILFVGPALGHQAVLSFYDFAKARTTILTVLNKTPFWLGATRDGRTVAFDQPGQEQAQAMLVDNFR